MPEKPVYNGLFNNSGVAIQPIYEWNADHTHLIKTGEKNLQEEMNAASVGCDVYGIIDRIMKGSMIEPPAPMEGQFLDVSGMSSMTAGEAFAASERLKAYALDLQNKEIEETGKDVDLNQQLNDALAQVEELKKKLGE